MSESPDYRVRFRDRALEDLGATFDYIRQESQSQERAMAWLDGAYKAAEALADVSARICICDRGRDHAGYAAAA